MYARVSVDTRVVTACVHNSKCVPSFVSFFGNRGTAAAVIVVVAVVVAVTAVVCNCGRLLASFLFRKEV